MRFTTKHLMTLTRPADQYRATYTDPRTPGLQFEIRKKSRLFRYRYVINGRQRSIMVGRFPGVCVDEARARVAEYQRKIALGIDPLEERHSLRDIPTIDEFFREHYLPHAKRHKRSWALDEMNYRLHLKQRVGHLRMNDVSAVRVQRLMEAMKLQGASNGLTNHVVVLLGSFYTLANKWKFPGVPPRSDLAIQLLPNPPKVMRYLSPDETVRLFEELACSDNPLLKHIVAFLLLTGARRSEALMARWRDFDLDKSLWTIPVNKSGRPRTVVIASAVHEVLSAVRKQHIKRWGDVSNEYVFPNLRTGLPYNNIYRAWNLARCRAGLRDVRMHDLRHSFASALVNKGVSIYEVQHLLGHRSINTTRRYAHLAPERLRESAEVASQVYGAALPTALDTSEQS